MSTRSLVRLAMAGLIVGVTVHLAGQAVGRGEYDHYPMLEEMAKVLQQVEGNYVAEPDPEVLLEGAIEGMLLKLDPYSAYIPKDMYRVFRQDTEGSFGGLGITIARPDEQLTVIAPLEGTPAAAAGILPGDRILRIEGESTEGVSLLEAVNKLRGEVGTDVTITIRHRGSAEETEVTITRATIEIPSVRGYRPLPENGGWDYWVDSDQKIGYIRLSAFQENTVSELDEAMKGLTAENIRGLVLDLRGNSGGLLSAAVAVADRFLHEGVIVSIRGRAVGNKEETAHASDDYPNGMLLAVLVNGSSASGSEIVAGALQDHGRAVLVGEETFGKGSVQNIIPLSDDASAIKLTTAKYYTPSGRTFHRDPQTRKGGLVPDIKVSFTIEQLQQLYRSWRMLSVEPDEGKPAADEQENPFVDAQLQRAVDLLVGLRVVSSYGK